MNKYIDIKEWWLITQDLANVIQVGKSQQTVSEDCALDFTNPEKPWIEIYIQFYAEPFKSKIDLYRDTKKTILEYFTDNIHKKGDWEFEWTEEENNIRQLYLKINLDTWDVNY